MVTEPKKRGPKPGRPSVLKKPGLSLASGVRWPNRNCINFLRYRENQIVIEQMAEEWAKTNAENTDLNS